MIKLIYDTKDFIDLHDHDKIIDSKKKTAAPKNTKKSVVADKKKKAKKIAGASSGKVKKSVKAAKKELQFTNHASL